MPKYSNFTGNAKVGSAIIKAEALLNDSNSKLLSDISKIEDFEYTSMTGLELVKIINDKVSFDIKVKLFNDSTSKAMAYFTSRQPDSIFLNGAKLGRSLESIINTIVHETMHVLDYAIGRYKFGHGNNDRTGKENSAPYKVGYLAYINAKKGPSVNAFDFLNYQPTHFIAPELIDSPNYKAFFDEIKGNQLVKNITFSVTTKKPSSTTADYQLRISMWGQKEGFILKLNSMEEVISLFQLVAEVEDLEINIHSEDSVTFEI